MSWIIPSLSSILYFCVPILVCLFRCALPKKPWMITLHSCILSQSHFSSLLCCMSRNYLLLSCKITTPLMCLSWLPLVGVPLYMMIIIAFFLISLNKNSFTFIFTSRWVSLCLFQFFCCCFNIILDISFCKLSIFSFSLCLRCALDLPSKVIQ